MPNKAVFEIVIEGNNVKAVKAIDGVETKLKGFDKSASSIGNIFGSLQTRIAIGVAAAATAFGVLIKNAIDAGDQLNKLSQKVGISVETLSTLKYAAQLNDVSISTLQTSLAKLSKNMNDFSQGTGEAKDSFIALGIKVTDGQQNLRNADSILFELADKFKTMPDGTRKTAYAMEILGRSGAEMIPFLNQGREGIAKLQEEARKLGLEMSTKTAREMEQFNDTLTRIKGSAEGAAVSIISAFGPVMVSILNHFAEGLDVIFGKTQLINGIQYKEMSLGVAAANAQTQLLVGTTKEYREELIKSLETQIGLAKATAAADQFKLDLLNTQAGIVSLFIDEDNILAENIRSNETKANILQQQLDIVKNFGKPIENVSNLVDKKLNDQWEKVAKTLKHDILIAGLSPQAVKLTELILKAQELKNEYSKIPGAVDLIGKGLDAQIRGAFRISNKEITPLTQFEKGIKSGLQPTEMALKETFRSATDIARSSFEEISFISKLNFELMQGYGSESFGLMSDSMLAFYELSGNKSKEFFALYKAFAVGQAVMNTYEGATKAIAQGGVFGPVMAAAVIAAGLANVAKIVSTQPGTGGVSSGGSGYTVPPIRNYNNLINNNNNSSKAITVNISVNGQVINGGSIPSWIRDSLAPEINKAIGDGVIKVK